MRTLPHLRSRVWPSSNQVSGTSTPIFSRSRMSREELLVEERLRRAVPLYKDPLSAKQARVEHAAHKPTWLDLFFDLSFVACLTVFATTHEAVDGQEVADFTAFIIIIWHVWVTKVLFDVLYARKDVLNRVLTFVYIVIFAFIGAFGVGYQPSTLYKTVNFSVLASDPLSSIYSVPINSTTATLTHNVLDQEPTASDLSAYTSWSGLCVVFAISRLCLFINYFAVILRGALPRRSGPGFVARMMPSLLLPMIGATVSGWIFFGFHWNQAATDTENLTRLAIIFSAIAFELILSIVAAWLKSPIKTIHSELLLERIALLTLIILGEGLIALTRSLSNVATAFGFTSGWQFVQSFCALGAYFLVFLIIFEPFNLSAKMKPFTTVVYSIFHLPFHVCLLLWLQSVVALLIFYNFKHGTEDVTKYSAIVTSQMASYFNGTGLPTHNLTFIPNPENLTFLANFLERSSDAYSFFTFQLSQAASAINQTAATYVAAGKSPDDYITQAITSFVVEVVGNEFAQTAASYGVVISNNVTQLLNVEFDLLAYNYGDTQPTLENYFELVAGLYNGVAPASLFTLPTAGGILCLTAFLTVLQRQPIDRFDWLLLGVRAVIGTTLCLLGLLDLGPTHISAADIEYLYNNGQNNTATFQPDAPAVYKLLSTSWLLPLEVFVFSAVVIFERTVLIMAKRAYGRDRPAGSPSPSSHEAEQEKATLEDQKTAETPQQDSDAQPADTSRTVSAPNIASLAQADVGDLEFGSLVSHGTE